MFEVTHAHSERGNEKWCVLCFHFKRLHTRGHDLVKSNKVVPAHTLRFNTIMPRFAVGLQRFSCWHLSAAVVKINFKLKLYII